ncbi:DUF1549 domain-containing protein [Singulisphaera rosea]
MARREHGNGGWPGRPQVAALAMLMTLAFVVGIGPVSRGAAPEDKAKSTIENLKALSDAVRKEKPGKKAKAESQPSPKLPARPAKVVSSPTLTPEGLDTLVDQYLATTKVAPSSKTTDVEFVRRIYLDITGNLPTPEQARSFVLAQDKNKRAKLIDSLLASGDYARNWARYWRDVIRFRATTQNGNRVLYNSLEDWLADQIAKNAPWDEVAKGVITATGRDDENGAVNFALAHETQAVEVAGEVSRIFLGVQIQCAQCHDHPSDSWKRQQFHEFAAFFAGLRRKQAVKPSPGQQRVFELIAQGKPRYTMPDKQDPQKQIFVAPKFFLDEKAEVLPNGLTAPERLAMAASYVTGQDNPWFAKAFVNRIWYSLMGEGFYSPVDDLGPERTAKAPEVLEALASDFQKGGYDVRWLFRTILNSRAYQREVRSTYTSTGRTSFACVAPSRLRSDQILDSLTQALNLPLGGPANNAKGQGPAAKKKDNNQALAKELMEAAGKTKGAKRNNGPRNSFTTLFGVDPSTPNEDVLGTIPQSLFLMNSPQVNNAIRADKNKVLGQILTSNPDNRAALGALYIRVLSREPTAREILTCGRYIETVGDRREAFEDILWSLVNSTEFITRR